MEFVKDDEKVGEKKTGEEGSLNSSSPTGKDSDTSNIQVSTVLDSKRSSMDTSASRIKPTNKILESTKVEMGEVREENERLKTLLAKVVKDYKSLQTHFFDIVQHEQPSKSEEDTSKSMQIDDHDPDHLVSLSLGTNSYIIEQKMIKDSSGENKNYDQEGLTLGLDFKLEGSGTSNANVSASNSVEEAKEEEVGEQWPPSKIQKSIVNGSDVDEASQPAHVKKTRVSVRARCETPTMHDGCQWRKYGQKIAKGNPCPRAYYRCTVAAACPVRKQVQRCAEDMSILITTYEGTHNHPLPISATAMASTTSAAARMLTSGSTTSSSTPIASVPTLNSNPITNLNALNFNLSNPNSHSRPFYFPNPTISSTPSYPTITLDLTAPPQNNIQTSQFSRIFPSRFSTNFNFSSLESNPTIPITSWSSGSYLNYNKSSTGPIGSLGPLSQQSSYLERTPSIPSIGGGQNMLTDTIAKAITSDPSFQSALANAITSYVGGSNGLVRNGSGLMLMQSPMSFVKSKSASTSSVENRENIN